MVQPTAVDIAEEKAALFNCYHNRTGWAKKVTWKFCLKERQLLIDIYVCRLQSGRGVFQIKITNGYPFRSGEGGFFSHYIWVLQGRCQRRRLNEGSAGAVYGQYARQDAHAGQDVFLPGGPVEQFRGRISVAGGTIRFGECLSVVRRLVFPTLKKKEKQAKGSSNEEG